MDLIALGSVKHNGKWFNAGESVKKVKKEDGERLIDLGVAKVDEASEAIRKAEEDARKKAEKEAAKLLAEELAKKEAEEKAEKENEKK